MPFNNLLWILLLCLLLPGWAFDCKNEKKCKTSRVHGLKTSDCYRMDFKEFPKCLPNNIEVIELSYNRIRKIYQEDLLLYTYLQHLYLTDNLIVQLKNNTFAGLEYLETLDLSVNGLLKVPPSIFQLPSLKNLYLSQNKNINIAESIEEAKPIGSTSLTKLDISYISEDSPVEFPDFKELPLIAFLNISGNAFDYLSPKHFAGLCNLQILDNSNVTAQYENNCDCWIINRWLTERNVDFHTFLCPLFSQECSNEQMDPEDLKVFEDCTEKFKNIKQWHVLKKVALWLGGVLLVILILGIGFVYFGCNKNRKTKKQPIMTLRERVELMHVENKVENIYI
ncbi:hypothetical protein ABEB36_011175 [Hypothenemus hampei]